MVFSRDPYNQGENIVPLVSSADEVQAYAAEYYEDEFQQMPPPDEDVVEQQPTSNSSGMIRAGIIGAVLLLAFIGIVALLFMLLQNSLGARQVAATTSNPVVDLAADRDNYSTLLANWRTSRATLDREQASLQLATEDADRIAHEIARQRLSLDQSKAKLEGAAATHSNARAALRQAEAAVAAASGDSLSSQLAASKSKFETISNETKIAENDMGRALSDFERISGAVFELERASSAANAAASASVAVVSAVSSAQVAISQNQDVVDGYNTSTLKNLEDDLFKEAQAQAISTQKAAQSADNALAVANERLRLAENNVSVSEAAFDEARQIRKDAAGELLVAETSFNSQVKERNQLTQSVDDAKLSVIQAEDAVAGHKSDVLRETTSLDAIRNSLVTSQDSTGRAHTKIVAALTSFQDADHVLRTAQKLRAQQDAVMLSEMNAKLRESLQKIMEPGSFTDPAINRFAQPSETLFPSGSAKLGAQGKSKIRTLIAPIEAVIAKAPKDVDWVLRIDGHTDASPLKGNGEFKDNWALSQARALAVVRFLVDQSSIPAHRLSANGFGEFKPINLGNSDSDLAQNRRIEIALMAR